MPDYLWNTLTLPPYDDYYIVTCKGGRLAMSLYYDASNKKWTNETGQEFEVVAWMPFPAAYGTQNR